MFIAIISKNMQDFLGTVVSLLYLGGSSNNSGSLNQGGNTYLGFKIKNIGFFYLNMI